MYIDAKRKSLRNVRIALASAKHGAPYAASELGAFCLPAPQRDFSGNRCRPVKEQFTHYPANCFVFTLQSESAKGYWFSVMAILRVMLRGASLPASTPMLFMSPGITTT